MRVIVLHIIDPVAPRIMAQGVGVKWFQQFRYGDCVLHPRIEPHIVIGWIKDNRHPVVND